jgi:hypothetical protein
MLNIETELAELDALHDLIKARMKRNRKGASLDEALRLYSHVVIAGSNEAAEAAAAIAQKDRQYRAAVAVKEHESRALVQ